MNRSYVQSSTAVQDLMKRVFGWMSFALVITGATSYYVYSNPALQKMLLGNMGVVFGLFIAQIALVIALSTAITRMSYFTALGTFSLYAFLTGITLSSIFMAYTEGSIFATFFISAGMFAAMGIYGAVTRTDLTSMGSFFRMALFGLILALLVNLFLQSSVLDTVTAIIGVFLFAGLTAYDVQKIKQLSQHVAGRGEVVGKIALLGALQLYLDFINLFLSLLRLMGQRKD